MLELELVVMRFVMVALEKIGVSVKIYVTVPLVSVATVKLLFVEDAKYV